MVPLSIRSCGGDNEIDPLKLFSEYTTSTCKIQETHLLNFNFTTFSGLKIQTLSNSLLGFIKFQKKFRVFNLVLKAIKLRVVVTDLSVL